MAIANYFYNETTRKYVALFGTLFNQITIERTNNAGVVQQTLIVPLAYGPFQKFLARITADPDLNRKSALNLPRLSFEINSMTYDPDRKIGTTQKMRKNVIGDNTVRGYHYAAAPYNLDMSLYIMAKYQEDASKILEQIIPFFQPDWTSTVKIIPDMDPIDIPIILNSVSTDEIYEGAFEERSSVLYTLTFTLKGWYFGPEKEKGVIKFVDVDFFANTSAQTPNEQLNVYPGLTANGEPTTIANNSIDYNLIEFDDDWGVIKVIETRE